LLREQRQQLALQLGITAGLAREVHEVDDSLGHGELGFLQAAGLVQPSDP
jgi:hypothetical protein